MKFDPETMFLSRCIFNRFTKMYFVRICQSNCEIEVKFLFPKKKGCESRIRRKRFKVFLIFDTLSIEFYSRFIAVKDSFN